MKRARRYRYGVHQHVQPVLAHGARHELRAEHGRAGGGHGGRHGGSVGPCARQPAQYRPALTLPLPQTWMLGVRAKRMSLTNYECYVYVVMLFLSILCKPKSYYLYTEIL